MLFQNNESIKVCLIFIILLLNLKNFKMSLNQIHSYDQKRVQRFGPLFGTIDCTINEHLTEDQVLSQRKTAVCGNFHISGKEYPVTLHELERIIETASNLISTVQKKYKGGYLFR